MSKFIEVRENMRNVKTFNKKVQKVIPQAAARAANRAADGARTAATRKLRENYTVKAGAVKKTFKLRRASPANLSLRLESRDGSLPLIRFKTKPSKPPAKQPKVLKASVRLGSNKPIPGAFVTQVGSHVGVLERVGNKRLPIRELYGPPVPVMLNNDDVREEVEKQFRERFEARMPHEVSQALGKMGL